LSVRLVLYTQSYLMHGLTLLFSTAEAVLLLMDASFFLRILRFFRQGLFYVDLLLKLFFIRTLCVNEVTTLVIT
jgi:hypothetical protein